MSSLDNELNNRVPGDMTETPLVFVYFVLINVALALAGWGVYALAH
jgi:hypothetical protein